MSCPTGSTHRPIRRHHHHPSSIRRIMPMPQACPRPLHRCHRTIRISNRNIITVSRCAANGAFHPQHRRSTLSRHPIRLARREAQSAAAFSDRPCGKHCRPVTQTSMVLLLQQQFHLHHLRHPRRRFRWQHRRDPNRQQHWHKADANNELLHCRHRNCKACKAQMRAINSKLRAIIR